MAVANPAAAPSTAIERVSPRTVEQAVNSLLKWRNSKSQIEKPKLFDQDDEFVYLILTLKKIPPKSRVNANKIPLPHSLLSEFTEPCLIIDDRPKSNLTKEDAQKKIKSENIPVAKVLKLSKLKSNYRPFEAKRKLCDSYHMFFADKSVIPLLPRLLGKHFFKKKKIPVPLDLKHKNWKEQIEKACSSALLFLRTGTCSVVRVAKVSMEKDEIVANVVAAINGIVELMPKKWGTVRSFHLKLLDSLALPLYQAVPDMKLKIEGAKNKEAAEKEDIVKDEAKKDLKVRKKKGRIHEVRYMDDDVGHELSQDESGGEEVGDMEEEDNGNDEVSRGALVDKKKKKGIKADKGVLSGLNSVKGLKKSAKDKDKSKKDGLSSKRKKENDSDIVKDEARKDLKVGKKGRIHEVRYMADNVGHEPSQDESGGEEDGDIEEEDNGNDEMSSGALMDRKKKKGIKTDKGVFSELNSVKGLKNSAKDKDKSKKHGLSSKRKKENDLHVKDGESGKKKKKRSGDVKVKAKKIKKAAYAD